MTECTGVTFTRTQIFVNSIHEWILDGTMESSVFQYGCPDICKKHINRPRTYSNISQIDLLTATINVAIDHLCPHYLKIGVSVGKTFSTVLHSLPVCAIAVAFDLEQPSPLLKSLLVPVQNESLPGNVKQFRTSTGVKVFYITGTRIIFVNLC